MNKKLIELIRLKFQARLAAKAMKLGREGRLP